MKITVNRYGKLQSIGWSIFRLPTRLRRAARGAWPTSRHATGYRDSFPGLRHFQSVNGTNLTHFMWPSDTKEQFGRLKKARQKDDEKCICPHTNCHSGLQKRNLVQYLLNAEELNNLSLTDNLSVGISMQCVCLRATQIAPSQTTRKSLITLRRTKK